MMKKALFLGLGGYLAYVVCLDSLYTLEDWISRGMAATGVTRGDSRHVRVRNRRLDGIPSIKLLAGLIRFPRGLVCISPRCRLVSVSKTVSVLSQVLFVAHYFPPFEIGFMEYVSSGIAGNYKTVLFAVFATAHNRHNIPS